MNTVRASDSPTSNPQGRDAELAQAKAIAQPLLPVDLMNEHLISENEKLSPGLAAHEQARAIIRLIQCPICSKPFNTPVTLPCGRSLCRSCLPESHERARITWPDLPDRGRAITCPFTTCGDEHTVADCGIDVVLYKLMDAIAEVVTQRNSLTEVANNQEVEIQRVSHRARGRLVTLYNSASTAQLPYTAEGHFSTSAVDSKEDQRIDDEVLSTLLDVCHKELDCQVCYNLMLDPVTTPCGHTLCRKCLVRSLDHSLHCPVCRRMVLIPPSLQSHPSNKSLGALLLGLCPELVAARKEAVDSEESGLLGDFDIPLFVVTLGFPGCPTFLRVFEPRYRLMLRRALEGNRTFGMVMHNMSGAPQGELGTSHFMQYGTLLRIENAQIMPDGTSIIETRGISRFKVTSTGTLDGYSVGRVERVEDIPLAEEEAIEAQELALPPPEVDDINAQLTRMSTQQLLNLALEFVERMRSRSAPWLHEGILSAYGGPPNDAAMFPYWFASILPTDDAAKYHMLQATSVRQRLKVTARWIKVMESQRWYRNNACTVL
ncbi:hypothetical protein K461DRAFT_58841 [Myriangium duriaei CBS 260.36]|uniref:RING-type domain-containing protein n=1 Tax=Myriangium duriaei CBS 260.36 TaxID=1168546 RepID=A0A9P4MHU1_9PEZI|nr:hypothetical protein K461DRAFT_58841 [Myriangium duriaei CBS 260.36]